MGEMTMILIYLVPAILIALAARYSRRLRGFLGWHGFGTKARPDTMEGAMSAVLATVGTGRDAATEGDWRVFRPSIGARLLTPALTVAMLITMYRNSDAGLAPVDLPPMAANAILLVLIYANIAMLRYRVEVFGDELVLRSTLWPARRFDLRDLRSVEEDAVHSYRLTFSGRRNAEILKTVAGAAELRHMLQVRLEQNLRG